MSHTAGEWTDDIMLPTSQDMACPACGEIPFNEREVASCLTEQGYYEDRHIPGYLIFTCGNADCTMCDNDFKVYLKAVITVTKKEWIE